MDSSKKPPSLGSEKPALANDLVMDTIAGEVRNGRGLKFTGKSRFIVSCWKTYDAKTDYGVGDDWGAVYWSLCYG